MAMTCFDSVGYDLRGREGVVMLAVSGGDVKWRTNHASTIRGSHQISIRKVTSTQHIPNKAAQVSWCPLTSCQSVTYLDAPSSFTTIEEFLCLFHISHKAVWGWTKHVTDIVDLVVLTGSREQWPAKVELC